MDPYDEVATFIDEHGLRTDPEYRILDLVSEIGEVAKNVNASTGYGEEPDGMRIQPDELGDVLFATYALAHETGIDPETALAESLDKYRNRMGVGGDPGSGKS